MVEIRFATEADKEAIGHVYVSATDSASFPDEQHLTQLIEDRGLLVALLGSEIVGFGGIDVGAREQVKWLYLLPQNQGTGVGSQLLARLENLGWEAGLKALRVHAAPGAVGFYDRHGYRQVPDTERGEHDHDGVEMVKDFRPSSKNVRNNEDS